MKSNQITERNGVTLLFVISMIVLFLLMGTAFVVVSNRFMQSARTRILRNAAGVENPNSGAGQRYVQQALFELVRGPRLTNSQSPLRAQSILGDMYGYGLEAHVKSLDINNIIETPGGTPSASPQFIRMTTVGLDTEFLDVTDNQNNFVVARPILNPGSALLSEGGTGLEGTVLNEAPGRFNGLLVTIASGPASGLTARIVDHQVLVQASGTEHVFMLSMVNSVPGITIGNLLDNVNQWNDDRENATRVIINGRAFAGTGAGRFFRGSASSSPGHFFQTIDPSVADLTLPGSRNPTLQPNRRFERFGDFVANYLGFSDGTPMQIPGNSSATNESYDAYDFQNMFLSGMYHQAYQAAIDANLPDPEQFLLPSFHRRELAGMNGVMNVPATNEEIERQSRYSFRPEYFLIDPETGELDARSTANANFPNVLRDGDPLSFTSRPLDVDNDGDEIMDGIWMDIGLPTISLSNGRLVRPLVSYMVKDLDGCANINVHSNNSHIASNDRFIRRNSTIEGLVNGEVPMQTSPPASQRIQGMGYGPAEIDLRQVFSNATVERLLVGLSGESNNSVTLPGRYGFDPENGRRRNVGGGPVPGVGDNNVAFGGIPLFGQDTLSAYKFFGWPNVGANQGGVLGGLFQSSPLDIYGRFRTDYSTFGGVVGMPVIDVGETSLTYSEIINNPYESTFAPPPVANVNDTLFTLNELERILRQDDHDAGVIPNRLATLAPNLILSDFDRYAVTTDGYEVPTQFASSVGGQQVTLIEKLYSILSQVNPGNVTTDDIGIPGSLDAAARQQEILANISGFFRNSDTAFVPDPMRRGMLSCDVRAGRPFDINRPFGNGFDDDADGIVDEPDEYNVAEGAIPEPLLTPQGERVSVDADGDGLVRRGVQEGIRVRQKFARDLYMLVLLTTEAVDRDGDGEIIREFPTNGSGQFRLDGGDFNFDFSGGGNVQQNRIGFRSLVAQWAINVADFRDPDSIMTPFEVDLNPYNGWDVDGDIDSATQEDPSFRRVFWGTERPELLLTECAAFHDTRTENLDTDNEDMALHDPNGMDPDADDQDFDSRMVPQASAFFELYAPWVVPGNNIKPTARTSINSNQNVPAEFDPNRDGGINLIQATPDSNDPVWRMLAVRRTDFAMLDEPGGIVNNISFNPIESDPDGATNGPGSTSQVFNEDSIKRYIYFNRPGRTGDPQFDGPLVYHTDFNGIDGGQPVVLQAGNVAVVGSAGQLIGGNYTTLLGRRSDHLAGSPVEIDNTRRIEMEVPVDNGDNGEGVVRVYSAGDIATPRESQDGTRVLPIVSYNDSDRSLGLSDPNEGYGSNIAENMAEGEGRVFTDPTDPSNQNFALGEPIDRTLQPEFYRERLRDNQLIERPFVILLQRLADPTRDWDAESNPYRSVDSIGCDLFAFNGVETDEESDDLPAAVDVGEVYFGSYERRGGIENAAQFGQSGNRFRMIWKTDYNGLQPTGPSQDVSNDKDPHVFNKDFINSLGRLNANLSTVPGGANAATPFAWLTWNNRPFVSGLELTNVPFTSSHFLTSRFDVSQKITDSAWNQYEGGAGNSGFDPPMDDMETSNGLRSEPFSGEFPHLLNFFANHVGSTPQPDLNAIFDYIEVPSRYVGVENFVNPANFAASTNPDFDLNSPVRTSVARSFAPPFDAISNFRAPGKVNINTITDFRVWNAVMGPYAVNIAETNMNGMADESFMSWLPQARFNPYRASNAYNRVPLAALVVEPSDCGLFRRQPDSPPSFGGIPALSDAQDQSFFDHNADDDGITDTLNNADRNAFYRNNKRNRLGNLVTGRSSTFAIWVTVGYFDVETQIATDNVGPDAPIEVAVQLLGAEATDDFGQTITRNRGFFVLDRSIPVAFEPGRNHNVQKAIRVSSFIE